MTFLTDRRAANRGTPIGMIGDGVEPRLLDDTAAALAAEIITRGAQPRPQLARRLGVSAASMTRLQRDLEARDIIEEHAQIPNDRGLGRPVILLGPALTPRRFVGIKMTASALDAVMTDLRCHPLARVSIPLGQDTSPARVMRLAAEAVSTLERWMNDTSTDESESASHIVAVAIALGGRVDRHGYAIDAVYLNWSGVDLAAEFAQHCSHPVTFVNDVEALARYEQWFGMGLTTENFSIVTLGVGIGHAVVHHRRILHRTRVDVSLVEHLPIGLSDDRSCALGHVGCIGATLTLPAIVERVREVVGTPPCLIGSASPQHDTSVMEVTDVSARDGLHRGDISDPEVAWLLRCCEEGSAQVRDILTDVVDHACRLLAVVADVACAEAIVISGELSPILDWGLVDLDRRLSELRDPAAPQMRWETRPDSFDYWAHAAAAVAIRSWLIRELESDKPTR